MRLIAVVVALCVVSACGPPAPPEDTDVPPLDIGLDELVADAIDSDISPKQRDAVVEAHQAGEMTYSTVESAFLDMVECLESAGFIVEVTAPSERGVGLPEPGLRSVDPPELTLEEASEVSSYCTRHHYIYVNGYYISQPAAVDAYLATFDAQRVAILECLERHDFDIEPSASSTALLYAVTEVHMKEGELCWRGDTFSGFLPPGVEYGDL